jgi:hypothetical protein
MFEGGVANFCSPGTKEAYEKLFNVENYLRFIVKWEILGEWGADWHVGLGATAESAMKMREEEAAAGIIDNESHNIMSYLMLTELSRLILDEHWILFKASGWGKQEMLKAELQGLRMLRNKVMHCRPLTELDLRTLERVIDRLADLTRKYRVLNQGAVPVQRPSRRQLGALAVYVTRMRAAARRVSAEWEVAALTKIGSYNRVDLSLNGAFAAEAGVDLFRRSGLDAFFAAVEPQQGRLALFLPEKLGGTELDAIFKAVAHITPLDSRDPVEESVVETNERIDALFRLPVEFPLPLRI